jgi:hypothetical protein
MIKQELQIQIHINKNCSKCYNRGQKVRQLKPKENDIV